MTAKTKSAEQKKKAKTNHKLWQWQNCAIILASAIISAVVLYDVHFKSNISELLPVSDELTNITAIEGIAKTGLPYLIPFGNSGNEDISTPYLYGVYSAELYLRAPFYFLNQVIPIPWEQMSSLGYFYLLIGLLLYSCIIKKNRRIPYVALSFLIVLIAFSNWTSASFHYVRYYPFALLSLITCLLACSYLYCYTQKSEVKKVFLILSVALIPTFFHNSNFLLFLLWVAWFFISYLRKPELIPKKTLMLLLASVTPVALVLGYYIYNKSRKLIDFNTDYLLNLKEFSELNFNLSSSGIFFTIILFGGLIFFKKITRLEKHLFIFSALYFVASSLILSVLTKQQVGLLGVNRYFFQVHVFYLFVIAILLSALFKGARDKIKNFPVKGLVLFFVLLLPILTGIYQLNGKDLKYYNFSILPQITESSINYVQNKLQNLDYLILTGEPSFCMRYFPDREVFMFRTYPEELKHAPDGFKKGIFVKKKDKVINIYGSTYVGNLKQFCKLLQYTNKDFVLFYMIGKKKVGKGLVKELDAIKGFRSGIAFQRQKLIREVCYYRE